MFCFPLCNKIFEQAPILAQWNIKGWTGVGSGDTYNGSAMGKLFTVQLVIKWKDIRSKPSSHRHKESTNLK